MQAPQCTSPNNDRSALAAARTRAPVLLAVALLLLLPLAILPAAAGNGVHGRATDDATIVAIARSDTRAFDLDEPGGTVIDNSVQVGVTAFNIQGTIKNVGTTPLPGGTGLGLDVEGADPVTVFAEDFESGAGAWSVDDLTDDPSWEWVAAYAGGAQPWVLNNGQVTQGERPAASGRYGGNFEQALVSPNIVIPACPASHTLKLAIAHAYDSVLNEDGGLVQVNLDNQGWVTVEPYDVFLGNAWSRYPSFAGGDNPLNSASGIFAGDSNSSQDGIDNVDYFELSEDQPNLNADFCDNTGLTFQVRLVFTSGAINTGPGWLVDDVAVVTADEVDNSSLAVIQEWDFLTDLDGWTVEDLTIGTNQWGPMDEVDKVHGGVGAWWFGSFNDPDYEYDDGADFALVQATVMDLSGFNAARIGFWHRYQTGAGDGGWLEVSTDAGVTWSYLPPLFNVSATNPGAYRAALNGGSPVGASAAFSGTTAASFVYSAFDLTASTGGGNTDVLVRFHFFSNWDGTSGEGWIVDDILVTGWDFQPHGSDSAATVGPVNAGLTQSVSFGTYDFDAPTDYRLEVESRLAGDGDDTNNATSIIVRVVDVPLLSLTADEGAYAEVIHGREYRFNLTVANVGNLPLDVTLDAVGPDSSWDLNFTDAAPGVLGPYGQSSPTALRVTPAVDSPLGEQTVTVSAIGDGGLTTTTLDLTVNVTNLAPTAAITLPLEDTKQTIWRPITFEGGGPTGSSDPDADSLAFSWAFGDGASAFVDAATNVQHTYTSPGEVHITLQVDDGGLLSNIAELNITIIDPSPRAVLTVQTLSINNTYELGMPILFDGTDSSDENPGLLDLTWRFEEGGPPESGNLSTVGTREHTYIEGGSHTVSLLVEDATSSNSTSLTVFVNTPPTAKILRPTTDQHFPAGDPIELNATGSADADGHTLDYLWTSTRSGELGFKKVSFWTPGPDEVGPHTILLRVDDHKAGLPATVVVQIVIEARPQTPPELTAGGLVPGDDSGDEAHLFTWRVTYRDHDADPSGKVEVLIDGDAKAMRPVDPTSTTWDTGVVFEYAGRLGSSTSHTYSFRAWDQRMDANDLANASLFPSSGASLSGPTVTRQATIKVGNFVTVTLRYWGVGPALSGTTPEAASLPTAPAGLQSIPGFVVTMTQIVPSSQWRGNVTVEYSFAAARTSFEESSIALYRLEGSSWAPVSGTQTDSVGGKFLQTYTDPAAFTVGTFALFGTPKKVVQPPGPNPSPGPGEFFSDPLFVGVVVGILAAVGFLVLLLVLRRRRSDDGSRWAGSDGVDVHEQATVDEQLTHQQALASAQAHAADVTVEESPAVAVWTPGSEGSQATNPPVVDHDSQQQQVVEHDSTEVAVASQQVVEHDSLAAEDAASERTLAESALGELQSPQAATPSPSGTAPSRDVPPPTTQPPATSDEESIDKEADDILADLLK